jgi:hypothetical protein
MRPNFTIKGVNPAQIAVLAFFGDFEVRVGGIGLSLSPLNSDY